MSAGPPAIDAEVVDALRQWLAQNGWPARAVLACSGGLDSSVMARVLTPLLTARGGVAVLAHLDHGLRGRAAAADAREVARMAHDLGVPLVRRTHRPRMADIASVGLQAAARAVRREFLSDVMARWDAPVCFVGHHEDDQVETLLVQKWRGRRLASRVGMAPVSGGFARPLLGIPRATLRSLAQARGWSWREDPSNADPRFVRVRVRQAAALSPSERAVVLSEALNRRERRTYLHCAAARAEKLVVRRQTVDGIELDRIELANLEEEIALSLLQRTVPSPAPRPPSRAALQGLLRVVRRDSGGEPRRVDLGGGVVAHVTGARVTVGSDLPRRAPPSIGIATVPATTARRLLRDRGGAGTSFALFDSRAVGTPRLTRAAPGRRIRPFGLAGSRAVRDLLAETGVPASARATWPIAESSTGDVLWIPGVRASSLHPLSAASVDALVLYTVAPRVERTRALERSP